MTLDETVRMALLVVLEELSPAERTVFVLHDVFQFDFNEIATIVGRNAGACRQLASRARRRIAAGDEDHRFEASQEEQAELAERFAQACRTGTFAALIEVLDPRCAGEFDSGGFIPGAPLSARLGAETIAETLQSAFAAANATFAVTDVNGEPGVIVTVAHSVAAVISLQGAAGHITHIHAIGNPHKLRHLARPGSAPRA